MDSFNFDSLFDTGGLDVDFGTGSFPTNDFGGFGTGSFPVPEFADYGVDFGTGGYTPEPGFTYKNVFGGAKKSGGFLDTLVGSARNLFGGGSLPADPYAGSEVSRSFGSPRSSYVDDTKQRMGSLLANVIDSFKEPRSVI